MNRSLGVALARLAPYLLACGAIVALAAAVVHFVGTAGYGYDYLAYDAAARRVLHHEALYLPGTADAYNQGAESGLFLYTPPVVLVFLPFTLIDAHTATLAWLVGRALLLVVGCSLLPVRPLVRAATLAAAVASFPVLFDLNLGNVSIVIFVLSALAWRCVGGPVAPVVQGALAFFRPPLVLPVLAWAVEGRIRHVVLAVGAAVVLVALSLPIVGLDAYRDYAALLMGLRDLTGNPHNLSLATTALALGAGDQLARLATLAGCVIAAAVVIFAARRRDSNVAYVVATTATLLASPVFHPHYLVLLLLPCALLAERGWWWALALPLLGWLPGPWLPVVVLAGLLLPLAPQPFALMRSKTVPSGSL